MTELETLLLKKLSELSAFQEQQSGVLQELVRLQSSRQHELGEQVKHLSEQLSALSASLRN